MTKFDRYLLSQLLLFFGFFALVLVALFWVTRAVPLFDRLIGDGQSVGVFLEFSALSLPGLVLAVLPLASFSSTVHVTNRLSTESELVAMLATGISPWRLARAVYVFAACVIVMMSALGHYLAPTASAGLNFREAEIARDMSSVLLKEGAFVHPSEGLTLYSREIDEDGILQDVFLSDHRNPESHVTHSAAHGYFIRTQSSASLTLLDGLTLTYDRAERTLTTTKFADYSYDITGMLLGDAAYEPTVEDITTAALVATDWQDLAQSLGRSPGVIYEEFHARFANPLLAAATALIGFAVMLATRFSRTGPWKQVLGAFVVLLILDGLRATLTNPVRREPDLWPMLYLPAALGCVVALALMLAASNPFRQPKGVAS